MLKGDEGVARVAGSDKYSIDDQDLVWYSDDWGKMVLAIPRNMVPDLLALVHTQHGHPGVAATLTLLRQRFYWPPIARDTREYVLSCGCRRRKRSRSQRIAMMPGRLVEPWEVLEMGLLKMGASSLAGNEYLLLVVDRASKFPFAFPLPTKKSEDIAPPPAAVVPYVWCSTCDSQ